MSHKKRTNERSSSPDLYAVLGVEKGRKATQGEIDKAWGEYKRRNPRPSQSVEGAYTVLSHPQSRNLYDKSRRNSEVWLEYDKEYVATGVRCEGLDHQNKKLSLQFEKEKHSHHRTVDHHRTDITALSEQIHALGQKISSLEAIIKGLGDKGSFMPMPIPISTRNQDMRSVTPPAPHDNLSKRMNEKAKSTDRVNELGKNPFALPSSKAEGGHEPSTRENGTRLENNTGVAVSSPPTSNFSKLGKMKNFMTGSNTVNIPEPPQSGNAKNTQKEVKHSKSQNHLSLQLMNAKGLPTEAKPSKSQKQTPGPSEQSGPFEPDVLFKKLQALKKPVTLPNTHQAGETGSSSKHQMAATLSSPYSPVTDVYAVFEGGQDKPGKNRSKRDQNADPPAKKERKYQNPEAERGLRGDSNLRPEEGHERVKNSDPGKANQREKIKLDIWPGHEREQKTKRESEDFTVLNLS
ncbi:hypothetical protein FQN57_004707 [Myotisia sp. PD_48]|nr:hypothetical protein FQN57_004707 [Myotisia sp. PD_48]